MGESASGPPARGPRQRASVLCRELDDEIVLFERDSGVSVHLNRTAGLIWYFLDGDHDETRICSELRKLFPNEEPDRIAREVQDTLEALRQNQLVE